MNNERYNQIIDEVYESYIYWWEFSDDSCNLSEEESNKWLKLIDDGLQWGILSKEEFVNKCKSDKEFSKRWRLKIEERELSTKEMCELSGVDYDKTTKWTYHTKNIDSDLELRNILSDKDVMNIPTKLITLTYNNETIEIYE